MAYIRTQFDFLLEHIALERTASAIHPTDLHPDADVGAGGGAAGGDGGDLAAVRQLEPEAP